VADPGFAKGGRGWGADRGEHVEHEPIMGVWGQNPQWGPGTELIVGSSGALPC